MSHDNRLSLAYSKLGLREPFIAAVMTRVKREITTAVPTAGTNGSVVKYSPDFMDKQNDEQLFGLVLHESLHVVLMHMWRRDGRDPSLWNYANDAIINAYIKQRNYQLPDGGVHLSWVKDSMSSEEVYNRLKQEQQSGSPPQAGGFDGSGDLEDALDEATKTDMEATIMAAAKMAKECGHGSNIVDRILQSTGEPKVRWQDVTRAMMTEKSAADYTYLRPSRRFIGSGLYLPSLHTEALGGLLIGFDTSGSMGPRECNQIAAEIQAIVDDLRPAFVEVVYCDASVTHVERFERDDLLQLKPKGGGGTRFQPVFEHAAQIGEHYCGMIFFTDMEGDLDECVAPEFPVIWADIGQSHPREPFGVRVPVAI